MRRILTPSGWFFVGCVVVSGFVIGWGWLLDRLEVPIGEMLFR